MLMTQAPAVAVARVACLTGYKHLLVLPTPYLLEPEALRQLTTAMVVMVVTRALAQPSWRLAEVGVLSALTV